MPGWYRTAGAASWRFLVIVAAVGAVAYALVYLRVVVLPIIVALLVSTLLLPIVRWLKGRGVPDSLAAAGAMLGAVLLIVAIGAAVAPSIGDQFGELRPRAEDGLRKASDVLADPPFNLSEREIREKVDDGIARLRENGGPLARGVQSGAVILGEIVTGLLITVLLTFFLLKDGERIWGYILSFTGDRSRHHADEIGTRVYAALAGYVRGIALVGLVDAILIGFALLIIGVPLVIPIMVITFFAAFIPLIGAFIAGLVAVLIALVSGGVLDAALVLGGDHPRPADRGPRALPVADGPHRAPAPRRDRRRPRRRRHPRRHRRCLPRGTDRRHRLGRPRILARPAGTRLTTARRNRRDRLTDGDETTLR